MPGVGPPLVLGIRRADRSPAAVPPWGSRLTGFGFTDSHSPPARSPCQTRCLWPPGLSLASAQLLPGTTTLVGWGVNAASADGGMR